MNSTISLFETIFFSMTVVWIFAPHHEHRVAELLSCYFARTFYHLFVYLSLSFGWTSSRARKRGVDRTFLVSTCFVQSWKRRGRQRFQLCCLQCFAGGVACEGVRRAASRSQCAAGGVTLRVSVACGIPQVVRLCCVSDGIQPLNAPVLPSLCSTQHRCSR